MIFWLALTLEDREGLKPWLQFGLLWGIAALEQHCPCCVSAGFGTLGVVSTRAAQLSDSFAGVVLASVVFLACITPWLVRNYRDVRQIYFHPRQLRRGTAAGQRQRRRRHMDAVFASRRRISTRCGSTRRWANWRYIAMRKRHALDYIRSGLWAICRTVREAIHLFLGGAAAAGANLVAGAGEKFAVPGIVGAYVLGIGHALYASANRAPG